MAVFGSGPVPATIRWTQSQASPLKPAQTPRGSGGTIPAVMETTLHRQLKQFYAPDGTPQEVTLGEFRIDAVRNGELIEIQAASLGALRDKTRRLLATHPVRIVKPLALNRRIVTGERGTNAEVRGRLSPRHEGWLHLFDDLVHFVTVFPHPRLTLDILLTEQLEVRQPHANRRRWGRNYRVCDRSLTAVIECRSLCTTADLIALLPPELPAEFTTADLARTASIPRWLAQRAAYCLRQTNAAEVAGKQGNAWVYRLKAAKELAPTPTRRRQTKPRPTASAPTPPKSARRRSTG